ncbi:MAG: family acetyltransferase [Anaerocolumna sp.]|jgi:RimJ/RimL family protein N-acetyltransferase|nr:family acetyltransferase [Anaerocolumna sp.]
MKDVETKELSGQFIILKPVDESDFDEIIKWRNDPENNRYLNQVYKLDLNLQKKWYYEKYLNSNDILFMIIAKEKNKRIGTIGINDLDLENRIGILGRLLIGEIEYRGSKELIEAMVLMYDYIFYDLMVENLYGHCVIENENVISFDRKFGFKPTVETFFPQYCHVNSMNLIEMLNTPQTYEKVRPNFIKIINYYKK